MAMKILVIGGTGIIGRACVELAVSRGLEVDVLTRGRRPVPDGARPLGLDISDVDAARRQLRDREYGAVIDWLAFTPEDIARHLELLRGRIGQYVFISSASAYQTPPLTIPVTEKTPLSNPYWRYSRDKIACEEMLAGERSVPITVVRPSHTYDRTMVPFDGGWTAIQRMRDRKPVIVPGDGTSLWTMTHSADFAVGIVGLLGRSEARGETFHITSETPMTWNSIYHAMAAAAGVEPDLVHVASDAIAAAEPEWGAALLGDKSHSMLFDNSKIRSVVPEFAPRISFEEQGAREIVDWHDADPARRTIDPVIDDAMDRLAVAYRPRAL